MEASPTEVRGVYLTGSGHGLGSDARSSYCPPAHPSLILGGLRPPFPPCERSYTERVVQPRSASDSEARRAEPSEKHPSGRAGGKRHAQAAPIPTFSSDAGRAVLSK